MYLSDAEFQKRHREWIASHLWKDFRKRALEYFRFSCAVCGYRYQQKGVSKYRLVVDHKRYWKNGKLIFGFETYGDVRLLCPDCNRKGVRSDSQIRMDRSAFRWQRAILGLFRGLWRVLRCIIKQTTRGILSLLSLVFRN